MAEVGIHHDDDVAGSAIQSRQDSRAQPAIGGPDNQTDPGEVQAPDRFLGSVAAVVIDYGQMQVRSI